MHEARVSEIAAASCSGLLAMLVWVHASAGIGPRGAAAHLCPPTPAVWVGLAPARNPHTAQLVWEPALRDS